MLETVSYVLVGAQVLVLGGMALLSTRSTPAEVRRQARRALETSTAVLEEMHAQELRWAKHKAEMSALVEEVSDTLERTEVKRKRAQTAAQRAEANRRAIEEPQDDTAGMSAREAELAPLRRAKAFS